MKKIFTILAVAFGILASQAASYRGFLDFNAGVGTGSNTTVVNGMCRIQGIQAPYAFGINMTHGCQITPFLYAGLGFGCNGLVQKGEEVSSYSTDNVTSVTGLNVPLYFDLRWDLNIRKKVTPFIDLKVGYQLGFDLGKHWDSWGYDDRLRVKCFHENGFYFQPAVGLRFRMGKKSGFNLGVTYNTEIPMEIRANTDSSGYDYDSKSDYTVLVRSVKDGALMLNLGFDF